MARDLARRALPIVGALYLLGLLAQVFLAGLGVFDGAANFATHRNLGYMLGLVTLVILALALVAGAGRLVIGLSVLLLVQFAMQSVFVAVRADNPVFAALHPVNGVLIILVVAALTALTWSAAAAGSGQRSHDDGTAWR
jgi:hypothetical protein